MAIEDLDLEFEEEEEDKGDGSIDQGVELDFSAGGDEDLPPSSGAEVASIEQARAQKQAAAAANATAAPAAKQAAAAAPQPQTPAQPQPKAQASPAASPTAAVDINALSTQVTQAVTQAVTQQIVAKVTEQVTTTISNQLGTKIEALQQQIQQVSQSSGGGSGGDVKRLNEADLKVAIAENETEFLVDYISEAKVLEHKINQILLKIHAKNPAFQKEILAVKKMLKEHTDKFKQPTKRKKEGGS